MLGDERDDAADTTTSTPDATAIHERSRWDIAAPLLVTGFAAVMFGWDVQRNQWSNGYYAAAVRSMGTSWHAFWYASVDSGGSYDSGSCCDSSGTYDSGNCCDSGGAYDSGSTGGSFDSGAEDW